MVWVMPTHIGQGDLLNLRFQMLIPSRDTLTEASRNNILPAIWASLSPGKLTQNLTITPSKCPGTTSKVVF